MNLIEARFEHYKTACLQKNIHEQRLQEVEQAFYLGALDGYTLGLNLKDDGEFGKEFFKFITDYFKARGTIVERLPLMGDAMSAKPGYCQESSIADVVDGRKVEQDRGRKGMYFTKDDKALNKKIWRERKETL